MLHLRCQMCYGNNVELENENRWPENRSLHSQSCNCCRWKPLLWDRNIVSICKVFLFALYDSMTQQVNHLSLKLMNHWINFTACGFFDLDMATLYAVSFDATLRVSWSVYHKEWFCRSLVPLRVTSSFWFNLIWPINEQGQPVVTRHK